MQRPPRIDGVSRGPPNRPIARAHRPLPVLPLLVVDVEAEAFDVGDELELATEELARPAAVVGPVERDDLGSVGTVAVGAEVEAGAAPLVVGLPGGRLVLQHEQRDDVTRVREVRLGVERGLDRVDGLALAVGIEAGLARLDQQQRLFPGAVEPGPVQGVRRVRRQPGFGEPGMGR